MTDFESDNLLTMKKLEYRLVLKCIYLKGRTPMEIKAQSHLVYGDHRIVIDDRRLTLRGIAEAASISY